MVKCQCWFKNQEGQTIQRSEKNKYIEKEDDI